jgi:predicted alpha/beta hydrolase family esterase
LSSHRSDPFILLQPGIGDSGPAHWQSLWEASLPNCVRVPQRDWDHPNCGEWVQAIAGAVEAAGRGCVLVAHSLGCLAVVHWLAGEAEQSRVRALLLVAPPDPDGIEFPRVATGFAPLPMRSLSLPAVVVASENDPYASIEFAERVAAAWQARLVNIGAAGHINAASGLADWPRGQTLLRELLAENSAREVSS